MNKKLIPIYIAVVIVAALAIWGIARSQNKNSNDEVANQNTNQSAEPTPTPSASTTPTPSSAAECKRTFTDAALKTTKVSMTTKFVTLKVKDFGDIKIELYRDDAPKTVENFVKLAQAGFYDCLTFHRVAKGFVIQGGDPDGDGTGGPGYTIAAEIKRLHTKGAVAMARQGDQVNPTKASSGSQFYIALDALPQLDGQYTVFGQVVAGMDIATKIGLVAITDPYGRGDGPPATPVVIEKAVISDK